MASPRTVDRSAQLSELVRFLAVGGLTNVLYFACLYGLRLSHVSWWLATGVAYAGSMVVNYLMQRALTFRSVVDHRAAGTKFLAISSLTLVLNSVLMEALVGHLLVHPALGQGISLAVTTSISYAGQKFWAFV